MTGARTHRVPSPAAGERLDRFVAAAEPDLSRSRVQALIEQGRITVGGRAARPAQRLRAGDEVRVDPPPAEPATIQPEPLALRIVWEDADLLVVDKPAGLVVHPGAGVRSGTLAHGLLHHDPAIAGVGGADRPGIVHRLDKDTSGLMVVARTARAHRALVEAMQRHAVVREYAALVWGAPPEDAGTVSAPVGRDPRDRTRMAVARRGGRAAVTHWRVVERFGPATRLAVRLETGRTHQIRVHLAHRRMPVVGDPVYGGRKRPLNPDATQRSLVAAVLQCLGRQALHAGRLEFTHPVHGAPLQFESALPEDIHLALEALRAYRDRAVR